MALTSTIKTVFSGIRKVAIQAHVESDVAGGTATIADLSAYTGPAGGAASKFVIEKLWWASNGEWTLSFDRATTPPIVTLTDTEGTYCPWYESGGLVDTGSGAGTGDLQLTAVSPTSGQVCTLHVQLRLKD